MKITKELLKRHGLGLCTEEEKKAVEKWFEQLEGPTMSTRSFLEIEENRKATWSKLSKLVPQLEDYFLTTNIQSIPLYRKAARYTAVACLFISTFFIGYLFGLPNAQANTGKNKYNTEYLYVYGGDNTYAKLDGPRYLLRFSGRLRLHNYSNLPKQIVCGKHEFTLEPQRTYYLTGSVEEVTLLNDSEFPDAFNFDAIELKGGFSMLQLYD
ncbi:MAG: hypothetical protein AAGI25_08940 [Bacteroidota bacterium]